MFIRKEFKKVVTKCVNRYDESWVDMDVLFADEREDDANPFLVWLKLKNENLYNMAIEGFIHEYSRPQLDEYLKSEYCRVFDFIEYLEDLDVCDVINLLADYAETNNSFGEAVIKSGKRYLSA